MAAGASGARPVVVKSKAKGETMSFWLESTLKRVYLTSKPRATALEPVPAARGGKVSFQACFRNDTSAQMDVACTATAGEGMSVRVRRVGFVPLRLGTTGVPSSAREGAEFVPGYVPEPLYEDALATAGPYSNGVFWVSVQVAKDAKPGLHPVEVRMLDPKGVELAKLTAQIEVSKLVLEPRKNFPVIHWFRGECLWDWYKTGTWEDPRIWDITRNYMRNLLEHGTDVIYTPMFFMRRETFERPCQLLIVSETSPGVYSFDFSLVKKYVDLAKEVGFDTFEWPHFWIYWGVENPARIYHNKDGKMQLLWPPDTDGHGPLYTGFLKQFLPAFHDFLQQEGILEKSYFHLSDEPSEGHIPNYKKARATLRELAPWMKVMDALSDINFGRQHLTDIPIPLLPSDAAYTKENIPHWVYFCCEPRGTYVQRLLDTPLPVIRMSGWSFYRLKAEGFLHWGYNYWHVMEQEKLVDPFTEFCGNWWPGIPPGDPFTVYPGADGRPLDSVRWEVWAESLQDYAILQSAGISPDDKTLADIKSYSDFPASEKWIRKSLRRALGLSD